MFFFTYSTHQEVWLVKIAVYAIIGGISFTVSLRKLCPKGGIETLITFKLVKVYFYNFGNQWREDGSFVCRYWFVPLLF